MVKFSFTRKKGVQKIGVARPLLCYFLILFYATNLDFFSQLITCSKTKKEYIFVLSKNLEKK